MNVTFSWYVQESLINSAIKDHLVYLAALLCPDGNAETFADIAEVAGKLLPAHSKQDFLRNTAIFYCGVHSELTIGLLNESVQKNLQGDEDMAEIAKEWEQIENESETIMSELIQEGKKLNVKNVSFKLITQLSLTDVTLTVGDICYYSDLLITKWELIEN